LSSLAKGGKSNGTRYPTYSDGIKRRKGHAQQAVSMTTARKASPTSVRARSRNTNESEHSPRKGKGESLRAPPGRLIR